MSEAPKLTGIEAAQAKLAQMKADGIEVARVFLTPTEKALADPKAHAKAVRAMCYECLGGEDCPNLRSEMAFCTDFRCPLWHMRAHQRLCTDNYGEPYGLEKRKAALDKANPQEYDDRMLLSAANNPTSRKVAIRAKCLQCTGGKKKDVTGCQAEFKVYPGRTYVGCPLYPLRPYQSGQDEPDTETETEAEIEDDSADAQ